MAHRRDFIKKAALGTIGISTIYGYANKTEEVKPFSDKVEVTPKKKPVIISTWNHGLPANEEAWKYLKSGKSALDAIEAGVKIPEGDPEVRSVGYGGFPDREGKVTLDACIMNHNSDCGSVSFLQGIKHPISVAKKVLQETPHVMLIWRRRETICFISRF